MTALARKVQATAGPITTEAGILADLPASVSFTMPTPPSANHLFKNVKGVGRVKTRHYDDFVRMGVADIRRQKVASMPGRVIAIIGVERMSGSADIDNRLKAMLDTIVEARVIADDSLVTAIAITWLPRANGLSWVRLLPAQRLDLTFHPSHDGASGGWYPTAPSMQGEDHGDFAI
ncbi:RusA family crossover junction endodeoxyribonuclease [Chelativorans sp.]|uniref:RusA family crossover junction endodeoxyribonuclease n=1 Tax=Chelativorans sp. TaxID=2203393 RepID=UPI0028114547|nr:RusA family crossover junction endodeoxyribonuclease [Chelativorans sp.]